MVDVVVVVEGAMLNVNTGIEGITEDPRHFAMIEAETENAGIGTTSGAVDHHLLWEEAALQIMLAETSETHRPT